MIDIRKPHWLAAYTRPRSEKRVLVRLQEEGVEAYLPLQKRLKEWSDRKKVVEEPVIRSYIFVRVTERDYERVVQIDGIVRYVCFERKAAPIPDSQIDLMKRLLGHGFNIEVTTEKIEPGDMVEIRSGSFIGIEGEVVKHKGKRKLMVRIDHISHSLLVELPKNYVTRKVQCA